MSTTPIRDELSSPSPAPHSSARFIEAPRRRWIALGVVSFVSFGHFIASSAYYAAGGTVQPESAQHNLRLVGALISEAASLSVLWYVLSSQGRGWKSIGWNLKWMDGFQALGLVFGSIIATSILWIPLQLSYHLYSGHYLVPKSLHGLFGFGISSLSVAFVCLNPFFEELIVRGYLMSELMSLGINGAAAALISVAVQMSYHLYQGFANGIMLVIIFSIFSIYFRRTGRIAPVILAHFCIDAYALIRGVF